MKGKEKCKALKEIRRQIAEANDIEFAVSECKHQGDCLGTCPKCESELRYLERELEIRKNLGKAVAVVGLSTSVCASMTACGPLENMVDNLFKGNDLQGLVETLEGDLAAPPDADWINTEIETTIELEGDIAYPEDEMGFYEESSSEAPEDDTDFEIAGALPKAP